jgi:hypothetical protein
LQAVALHQSNQLIQAEQCYRVFLKEQPAHADCLHQLGALLVQRDGKAQVRHPAWHVGHTRIAPPQLKQSSSIHQLCGGDNRVIAASLCSACQPSSAFAGCVQGRAAGSRQANCSSNPCLGCSCEQLPVQTLHSNSHC